MRPPFPPGRQRSRSSPPIPPDEMAVGAVLIHSRPSPQITRTIFKPPRGFFATKSRQKLYALLNSGNRDSARHRSPLPRSLLLGRRCITAAVGSGDAEVCCGSATAIGAWIAASRSARQTAALLAAVIWSRMLIARWLKRRTIEGDADRHAANVLPIIREITEGRCYVPAGHC
jgi:hypothetical protein